MKALILAAGFGKRLRPITNTIPKSMVEVNGTPLLCNALNNVTACGITEIGIVVGHMADECTVNVALPPEYRIGSSQRQPVVFQIRQIGLHVTQVKDGVSLGKAFGSPCIIEHKNTIAY